MNVASRFASTSLLVAAGLAACSPVERTYPTGSGGSGGTSSSASTGGAPATTSSTGGGAPSSSDASSSSGTSCTADADCPSGPQSTPTCLPGGVCGLVCATAHEDCDGDPKTGCEADLGADKDHCGSCAKACFYSCAKGTCTDPTSVVAGTEFTCALLGTGDVMCWGANGEGQVGNGTMGGSVPVPSPVALPGPAVEITAGISANQGPYAHACARLASGDVFCWGSNQQAQLGNFGPLNSPVPVQVPQIGPALQVSAGSAHTCAVMVGGQLFCWGSNNVGQIGNGQSGGVESVPVPVNIAPVSSVSAGGLFTCAVDMSGKPFCWGSNQYGKVGTGDVQSQHPQPMPILQVNNALGISTGANHACTWTATEVYCWGDNSLFAVGVPGAPQMLPVPTLVSIGPATSVAVGADFGGALLGASGELWMWGTGPLGDGAGQSPAPKQIVAAGVVSFDAGGRSMTQTKHACAIKSTGELVCWGDDSLGQLGDGNVGVSQPKPITVPLP